MILGAYVWALLHVGPRGLPFAVCCLVALCLFMVAVERSRHDSGDDW